MTLNTVCQFCNDTGVTPDKTICTRCSTFARLAQDERDARLADVTATPEHDPLAPIPDAEQTEADRARIAEYRAAGVHGSMFKAGVLGLALVAAVAGASVHAAPANTPNVPPTGCTITQRWEDGSRIAACPDGKQWTYDPDGLGPYCPKVSTRYGDSGWHTSKATTRAHKQCGREVRKR